MPTSIEKVQFSERLLQALSGAGVSATSPTAVARKFNLLYPDTPVSVQAVRRWLEGTAIPSQDKLVVLAAWLRVSPEWLRFGDSPRSSARSNNKTVRETPRHYDSGTLATLIELLSEEHRQMIARIVTALLESEGKTIKPSRK
jgi:transcriptional regulator with XRE-family HTH domain